MSNLIPDFKVYSNTLELLKGVHPLFPALPESTDEAPIIPVVASSTEQDLHEDTMAMTALQDMCDVPIGQSVWRNHDYTVPDSFFGKTVVNPVIVQQNGIADLHTAYGVYLEPFDKTKSSLADLPPNWKTYDQIKSGAKLGVSGGFIILEWGFEGDDWFSPIIIHHVRKLEDSIVGVPANLRSWVENSIKGLFERCVREDNGEDALKLAPAYKGMFFNDYRELTKSLRSNGLRTELDNKPVRAGSKHKLFYEPAKKHFVFQSAGGRSQVVAPETISTLIQTYSLKPKAEEPMNKDVTSEEEAPPQETIEETPPVQEETPIVEEVPSEETTEPTEQPLVVSGDATFGVSPLVTDLKTFANALLEKAVSDMNIAIKAGAEFNKENSGLIKTIHGAVCSMVGNVHCEEAVGDNDEDTKSLEAIVTKAVKDAYKAMEPTTLVTLEDNGHNMDAVITSLESFSAQLETVKGLPGLQTEIGVLTKAATDLRQEFDRAKLRVNALNDDLHSLTNMPLGKPTDLHRSVQPTDNVTTHNELLQVNKALSGELQTLSEALSLTDIVTEKRLDGAVIEYRHWPEGVGKGVRPALTLNQQSYMHPQTWSQYNAGLEAYVPKVDDPLDKLEKAALAKR